MPSIWAPRRRGELLYPLQHRRDALANTDAHRDESIAPAGTLQLARRGQRDARSRGAQGMADRDRATVRVDPAVVKRQFEPAQAGEDLRRKSLVDLDDVDVLEGEAGALQRLFCRRHRPEP